MITTRSAQQRRLVLAAGVLAIVATGAALAGPGRHKEDVSVLVRACRHVHSGFVRMPAAGEHCRPSEELVVWSARGPRGERGEPGPAGPQGPTGPTGQKGA